MQHKNKSVVFKMSHVRSRSSMGIVDHLDHEIDDERLMGRYLEGHTVADNCLVRDHKEVDEVLGNPRGGGWVISWVALGITSLIIRLAVT